MGEMICLCGLSGSGKTYWAKNVFLPKNSSFLYFNPDEYYERINGDEKNRENTFEIWHSMFRDIHTAELAGRNVLIDSDNLTTWQRMQWLEWFPSFYKKLIRFDIPYSVCSERVAARERKVPDLYQRFLNADMMRMPSVEKHRWDEIETVPMF